MNKLITVSIIISNAIFVVFYLFEPVFSCMATNPSSNPTVTTTTTAAATTTTTANPCSTCTVGILTLTMGTTTPTAAGPTLGADGCVSLVVTCDGNGAQVFMQFNVNQGGPLNPTGNVVMATLNCVNGQWEYEPGGGLPNRVITEVNCVGGNG